ncbi:MAG: AraC family transcriptional regulator [Paenibacillus sp.]|nr:AraC family transcriptional regulator [Paenibacillus sp.]
MIHSIAHYFEHNEPNWSIPESKTRNTILLFVTAGTMIYTINGTAYTMEKRDILLVPKGVYRSARNLPDEAHDMYVFHFRCEDVDDGLPILSDGLPHIVRSSQFEYMKQRFSFATQNWLKESTYSHKLCFYALMEILTSMNEEIDSQTEFGKAYGHVVAMQSYILEHYRRTIPITELAELIGRTPNYASAIFKRVTGKTVSAYIQQIRISAACTLLANSQMSVGEISEHLGFCEQSYFNKVFKRQTGISPSKYINEPMAYNQSRRQLGVRK